MRASLLFLQRGKPAFLSFSGDLAGFQVVFFDIQLIQPTKYQDLLAIALFQNIKSLKAFHLLKQFEFWCYIKNFHNINIVIMPLELSLPIVKWLKIFSLLHGEIITNDRCQISYNDQLYFQNGFLIGQLLKNILKSKGYSSDALMRIRKIAHISSNQNWRIIKQIMQEINFQENIDPHNITLELIHNILQFLFEHFSPKIERTIKKKDKKTYIDPATFSSNKQLQQSSNLLQFFILAFIKTFHIPMEQCLGLLVDNCKYLKKIILEGTNNNGYLPIINFYKLITQSMPLLNNLISEQQVSQAYFMNCLGLAVLSQNQEVCDIGCIIIDNLQSNRWLQLQGYVLLLRSPNDKVLDLLLRKVYPNFSIVFNPQISSKFPNQYVQLLNYGKLLQYLHKSIYLKEILQLLPLGFYLQKAFQKFEPDIIKNQSKKIKLAANNLLKVLVTYFWTKIGYQQKNRTCLCFEPQFCESQEERLVTLSYLFEIITQLSIRQAEFVKKFYKIILKYYNKCTIDIRSFILSNLTFLYQNNPDHFPIGFFLETYHIASPVQTYDYQLIELLSRNAQLKDEEVLMLLKVCTIYYYQQLQAACFIVPINNLLKRYTPTQWASQISQQILVKWPSLPIPPFQMLPPNTNKIKFRSIGLKKKEMLQFTQLNRYKSILKLLTQVKDRQFLITYGKSIESTIKKVQKSKIKEMQNTKIFLNNLLAKVDTKKIEIKQQKARQNIRSRTQNNVISDLSEKLETDSYLQRIDDRDFMDLQTPIRSLQQQNQFMRPRSTNEQENPLLPFSQESFPDIIQRNYSDDSLFENYELIYIKNTSAKYSELLKNISQIYVKSANLEHFLKNLNIFTYFEKDTSFLQSSQSRLKLIYDNSQTISFKLTIQMALLLFEFKKSRRINIKCIQSFYQLLTERINFVPNIRSPEKRSQAQKVNLNAKIDFKYQITKKTYQSNKNAQKYMVCFDLVSEILKKSIGIFAVEPISCIISQILPFSQNLSSSKMIKSLQKSRISQVEQRQYEQLQKIIENQSILEQSKNKFSTPLKRNKNMPPIPSKQIQGKIKQSQKWASIQKKVIMRRRQLEGRPKTINES